MSDDNKIRPNTDPIKPALERKGLRPTDFNNAPASKGLGKSDHAASPIAANTVDVPVDAPARGKGKPSSPPPSKRRADRTWRSKRRRLLLETTSTMTPYYALATDRWINTASSVARGAVVSSTTGDHRFKNSGSSIAWLMPTVPYFAENELIAKGNSKLYMELHFYNPGTRFNDNSPPFICVGRAGVNGSGYTNTNTVAYQPWKNTTVSEVRYNGGASVDTISGVYYDSGEATFMIAVDLDNNKIWFGKDGSWVGTGTQDPATNQGGYWITAWDTATYATGADSMDNPIGIYVETGGTQPNGEEYEYRYSEEYWTYSAPTGFAAWPKFTPQVENTLGTPETNEWYWSWFGNDQDEFCHHNAVNYHTGLLTWVTRTTSSYDTFYRYNKAPTTGKWYWEVQSLKGGTTNSTTWSVGMVPQAGLTSSVAVPGGTADNSCSFAAGGSIYSNGTANPSPYSAGGYLASRDSRTSNATTIGDTYMFAWDRDNQRWYVGINGTWLESQDPTNASHGLAMPATADQLVLHCESGSIAGLVNTGGKAFLFDPPTGYEPLAACAEPFLKTSTTPTYRTPTHCHANVAALSSTTIDAPTGLAEGDYMVMVCWSSEVGSGVVRPTLTGEGDNWEKADEVYSNITSSGETWWSEIYFKPAGASEPSTYTVNNTHPTLAADIHAVCFAVKDGHCDSLGANETYSLAWYNPTKPISPTVVMTMPGARHYAVSIGHTKTGSETINPPSGMTLLATDTSLTSFFALAEKRYPTDGSVQGVLLSGGEWDISGASATTEFHTSDMHFIPYIFT